jgi:hypothetical protein
MPRDGLLRRLRRRRLDPGTFVPLPDSHPRRGLIAEPIRISRLEHAGTEIAAGDEWLPLADDTGPTGRPAARHRVTFLIEVRSADGARCPNVAVEVRLSGPERERTVSGATDLLGRVRFRMAGPLGGYRCEVLDVAAGGLDWDREAGPSGLSVQSADPAGPV